MNQPFDLNTSPVLRIEPNRYLRVTSLGWCPPGVTPTVKFCPLFGDNQQTELELTLADFLQAFPDAKAIQPLYAPGQVYVLSESLKRNSDTTGHRAKIVSVTPDDDFGYFMVLRDCETGEELFADVIDFQKAKHVLVQIH